MNKTGHGSVACMPLSKCSMQIFVHIENRQIPGVACNLIGGIAWCQENVACSLSKGAACSPEVEAAGNPILEDACNLMEAVCNLSMAAYSL